MNKNIVILPSFCVGICISLLVLPIPWVIAWFIAGLIHELGHLGALRLLRVPVLRITLGFQGANMETGYMKPVQELFSALAGPLAGLCCLLVSAYMPFLAVCGFVQSVYNLLPFPDYDGGRVLRVLLNDLVAPHRVDRAYRWILIIFSAFLILIGMYLWFVAKLGPIFLLIFMISLLKSGIIKIPCKRGQQIVQ